MAYIQDTTQSFMVTLVGEGIGTLTEIAVDVNGTQYVWTAGSWEPNIPIAFPGDTVYVQAIAENTGVLADTIYAEFVSANVIPSEALIQTEMFSPGGGGSIGNGWTFTMPVTDVNITINAGHEE